MIDHATLEFVRVSCIILSLSGIMLRDSLMLAGSSLLKYMPGNFVK